MNQSFQTIAAKKPVWIALSELFLDTELQASDFDRLASQLAASAFSVAEIEEILRLEDEYGWSKSN